MAIIAPIFQICRDSPEIQNVFGSDPIRVYPFGGVDDSVETPYAIWQNVGGSPANYIGNRPDVDQFEVQIDIYGKDLDIMLSAATVLRDVLEKFGYITRLGSQEQDTVTKLYNMTFDYTIFTDRG